MSDTTVVSIPTVITTVTATAGLQGPSGESSIGGYPVQITNATTGDMLILNASNSWTNTSKTTITDGGNF